MLSPYQKRYGSGYNERAQEAVRCYGAHAYLACCVLCGAAVESILLVIAITKHTEDGVIKAYKTASGRSRIEKMILGKSRKELVKNFDKYTDLLKYWRDIASHGQAVNIGDNEAFTSLAMMLRFSKFVDDNWNELTN